MFEEERKQADVLCVGGGIAGLMAAIRAAELGAKVIVAEKSNILRSGSAGMGNDHFQCYIPEVHGDFEVFAKELLYGQMGPMIGLLDREVWRYWFENTFDILKLWESWGIPIKYQGKYEFAGHAFPGRQLNHLKYSGECQKSVLTEQALKRGAQIINRVMVFDLLRDREGSVIGAIGVSTRDPKVILFEAKSVVLGTGSCTRMYPATTPSYDANRAWPITLTGDGRAMAYRAGGELVNLELTSRHAGPKYFVRSGQATWVGVLRDRAGKAVGPFVSKPDRVYGDMTTEVHKSIFDEYVKSGKGPIYMDMDGISDEDLEYMVYWLKHEGNLGLLDHLAEEGIDLKKAAIEFQTFEMAVAGGIRINYKTETSVKGLYAAGDESISSISPSATFGWAAGENAAKYAKGANALDIEEVRTDIEAKKALLREITARKDGARWQEANSALQQIMFDYAGYVRSEVLLEAGLDLITRLKSKARTLLMAENPHELMHCLEVLNLLDIGELVFISANDRKETRGLHVRSDYKLTNPLLGDKRHIIKKVDGKPVTGWVEVGR